MDEKRAAAKDLRRELRSDQYGDRGRRTAPQAQCTNGPCLPSEANVVGMIDCMRQMCQRGGMGTAYHGRPSRWKVPPAGTKVPHLPDSCRAPGARITPPPPAARAEGA